MPEAERQHPTGGDFTEVPLNRSSGTRLQLLSNDATQRVLELRHLPVEVLPQRRVDERLVPGRAPGFFRHSKEAIHDILVQPNRDSSLALGLRFGWKHSASLSFAEVVSVFHRPASYSARSWASAVLAEMIRIFSPRQVYTTTSNRSAAPMPSVTNRCSPGSNSSSGIVIAKGSSKTGIASGIRTPCLRKLIPAFLSSSHSKPTFLV